MHFADDLISACEEKNSISVVGIDPRFNMLPDELKEKASTFGLTHQSIADVFLEFSLAIIDAVRDHCPAVKPQIAFFEQLGWPGVKAYWDAIDHARKSGLIVIGDVKRSDIASTAKAYATGHLGWPVIDKNLKQQSYTHAVTVNPYLGSDSIEPFLQACREKASGIFVLAKTSNPSSDEIQNLSCGNKKIFHRVAALVNQWGEDLVGSRGYSSVGAVVGATFPKELKRLRELMPKALFLIPGYGAQGGTAEDIAPAFDADGLGAVVSASRSIIYAYTQKTDRPWKLAVTQAILEMNEDISKALHK